MWQDAVTYLIVAGASAWVAWTLFLPATWRAALRARWRRPTAGTICAENSTSDCSCAREPR